MLSKAIAAGAVLSGAFLPHQSDGSNEYQLASGAHGFIVATQAPAVPSDGVSSVTSGTRMTRVRLNTGVELQVAESGPADGNPVLFLHGYTDSWFSYSLVLDKLSPDVRAIAPSQRGHGDSDRPACCYRIADFAADAVALLDALGIERATVVGHSMGSFVAQRVAIDRPDRVDRLVLIGSGPTLATPAVVEFNDILQAMSDSVPLEFVRDFQVSTVFEPLPQEFLSNVVRESSKLPVRVWHDVLAGILAGDARSELHHIQAKTLIVWGEHDALFVRADQDALLRAVPKARLLSYPDVAHAPHWEQPDRFAADLNAFLNSSGGGL